MTAEEPRPSRWPLLVLCLALALVAFGRGLGGQFLNFDDNLTVLGNPAFRAGFPDGLWTLLDPSVRIADVYLPVSYLSLWIDQALFGTPLAFQLHSLVLHGLAGFVLVLLLLDLGFSRGLAVLGAVPFLVHPALAESVVWISSRKDVLSGLLALLALWLGRRSCRGAFPPSAVVLAVLLACYAKATVLVLPALAFPLWRVAMPAPAGRRFWRLWAATTIVCGGAALHHGFLALQAGTTEFAAELAAVPGTFLHYLGVVFWPVDLAVHRPRELLAELATGALAKTVWLAVLAMTALVVALRARPPLRFAGLGLGLALLALLPFNGFQPAIAVAAADRYLYLALPFVGLMVAGLAGALPGSARLALPLAAACAVPLAWLANGRAPAFTRSDRLWNANLEVYPQDAVALTNLAEWHLSGGGPQGARAARPLLERARDGATLVAHRLRAHVQLFRCSVATGDLDGSLVHLRDAIALADDLPGERRRIDFRLQLAEVLARLDRAEDADAVLDDVLALDPAEPQALGHKASHLLAAAAARAKRLPLDPGSPDLVAARKWIAAAQVARSAAASVHTTVALSEYHRLLGETTKAAAALEAYRGAAQEEIHLQRARIYESEGLVPEAVRALEEGLQAARGASIRLALRLGALYVRVNRVPEAQALLRRVYDAAPDHPPVRRAYALALTERARRLVGVKPVGEYAPLVRKAMELAPDIEHLAWLEAAVLDAERKPGEALVKAREAAVRLPKSQPVQALLLELLKKNGFRELLTGVRTKAFAFFRELVERAPAGHDLGSVREVLENEFMSRHEKATAHFLADRLDAAAKGYESALEIFPGHDDALLKLGMVQYKAGRFEEARKLLRRSMAAAEKRGGDPGMALLYRMRTLQALQQRRQALDLAEDYLAAGKLRDAGVRERIRKLATRLRGG